MRRSILLVSGILVLVLIAGLLRLNDLSLYTDSTRYLLWAQSLSEFGGWVDNTQPVPESYVVNAPLYPLFIAPSQWFGGAAMDAAKSLNLLYGLTAIVFFFLWTRQTTDEQTAVVLALLLAAMPMTVVLFTEVLSESAYLLMVFASLFLLQRRESLRKRERMLLLALLALLPLMREIGIALVGGVVLVHAVKGDRRFALAVGLATISVFILWSMRNLFLVGTPDTSQATNMQFILQRALTTEDESILTEFLRRIAANVGSYRFELGGMIVFPVPFPLIAKPSPAFLTMFAGLQAVKSYLFLLFVPTVAYGMWRDWLSGPSGWIRVLFVLFSLGIILVYPVQDVRFLYPLLPFIFTFASRSVMELSRLPRRTFVSAAGVIVALILVPNLLTTAEVIAANHRYLSWLSSDSETAKPPGPYFATPWEKVGAWVRENTPPGSVIASSAKEVAPFIGARTLLEVNKAVPRPQFEEMLRDHDVSLLVAPVIQDGLYAYGLPLMESRKIEATVRGTVGSLAILSVPSLLTGPGSTESGHPPDTLLVSNAALGSARRAILSGRYAEADTILTSLLNNDPGNAEAAFQRVTALSLSGSVGAAVAAQQILFQSPRSTSYLPVSRRLLDIAQHLANAEQVGEPTHKAGAFYQAARIAWDLGYNEAARGYLDNALTIQHDAFEPLIWSVFYAIQESDLVGGLEGLERLQRIDRDDPIVSGLTAVYGRSSRLQQETDPLKVSTLLLDLARAYERLELFSAAIDAAIAAVRTNPENGEASGLLRTLLSKSGRTFAVDRLDAG